MKKVKQEAVVINPAVADALSNLLFSSEGGVDMTPIIQDLGNSVQDKLTVGLLMKGMLSSKVADEDKVRFRASYWASEKSSRISYVKMELVNLSYLRNEVTLTETIIRAERLEDGTYGEFGQVSKSEGHKVSIEDWMYGYEMSEEEIQTYCRTH